MRNKILISVLYLFLALLPGCNKQLPTQNETNSMTFISKEKWQTLHAYVDKDGFLRVPSMSFSISPENKRTNFYHAPEFWARREPDVKLDKTSDYTGTYSYT